MTTAKKNEVKNLLRQTFWQLDDIADNQMTTKLVRQFLRNNVKEEILEEFAINVSGVDWWQRIEKLCWCHLEARKWLTLQP